MHIVGRLRSQNRPTVIMPDGESIEYPPQPGDPGYRRAAVSDGPPTFTFDTDPPRPEPRQESRVPGFGIRQRV